MNRSKKSSPLAQFTNNMPNDSTLTTSSPMQCMVEVDRSRPSSDRQAMFNTPAVHQPNMNMVIVLIVAMFKLLMLNLLKFPKYSLLADPYPALAPVPSPSYPSCSTSTPCRVETSVNQLATGTAAHSDPVCGWNFSLGFWKYRLKLSLSAASLVN